MEMFFTLVQTVALLLMFAIVLLLFILTVKEAHKRLKVGNKYVPIKIRRLNPKASIPALGIGNAAGYDLTVCIDEPVTIEPGETVKFGTGLSIELPTDTFGAIFARSGLSTRSGLRPATCVSVIDPDYRGEYIIPLHNDSNEIQVVNPGDRVAQLVILPCYPVHIMEVGELSETERGEGGFGSTGR